MRLAVDIGGTFTDVAIAAGDGYVTAKCPTTPAEPACGVLDGIRLVLERAAIVPGDIGSVIHGTTLAANALIERKGATVASLTTEGFRDILEIAYERRYDQYDIFLDKPEMLVPRERCFTVPERIDAGGRVMRPLDESAVDRLIDEIEAAGADSVAIGLLHSYANPAHEERLRTLIHERRPDLSISLSSKVCPVLREYDRLSTTVADAFIKPLMSRYLRDLERRLAEAGIDGPLFMMTSGGGMTTIENALCFPIRLVESGPCGGAILAARIAQQCGIDEAVSLDMGGTTAKICLIDDGEPQTSRQFEIARAARFIKGSGLPVRIPVIEMIEIGAGGGSVAAVDGLGRIHVGPDSAGADPGPACYAKGGERATVTDADAVAGFLDAERFAEGRLRLDIAAAKAAVDRDVATPLALPPAAGADGIVQIVDENMANAARIHAAEHGKALGPRTMIAFGGNGPLHATRVAEKVGISRIIVPPDPGVGSAVGFLAAPVSYELVRSLYTTLGRFDAVAVNRLFEAMEHEAQAVVRAGAPDEPVEIRRMAFMRYQGQGHEVEVPVTLGEVTEADAGTLRSAYEQSYARLFGRHVPNMEIEVMNWAVVVSTRAAPPEPLPPVNGATMPGTDETRRLDLGNGAAVDVPCFARDRLTAGDRIVGPALVVEAQTTTYVAAGFDALVDGGRNIVLTHSEIAGAEHMSDERHRPSAIELQVMWNRLLAVVEEQAQALVRTAFSPIVRECGDISAGIFDLESRMLAQAVTGTPGHINTMAEACGLMVEAFPLETMRPGDIYLTNDPWLASGHLNDFLLVAPVFRGDDPVALVSCTSHLIDLGGLGMGPDGSDVYDEGLLIPPARLVEAGQVNELLMSVIKANSRFPIANEGDIYALIACCDVGAERLAAMMDEFGLERLDTLADYIITTSRKGAVAAIAEVPNGVYRYSMMIDGYESPLELAATLAVSDDAMELDFAGTSPCSRYGINVPINYTTAYSVFGLRCIVGPEIPNNAGSLEPFRVTAPEGSIINAPRPVPVAMRHAIGHCLPDVVLGCLHQALEGRVPAEGASCMWDITMRNAPSIPGNGNATAFAIDLTHNGGTGARPTRDGLSATAYPSGVWGTQVEIAETVAPLHILRRELKPDSGGAGRHRGGLGQFIVVRSSEDADISLFAALERIAFAARGRAGGGDGAAGRLALASGSRLSAKGMQTIPGGERLIVETPGGGGYGDPGERDLTDVLRDVRQGLVSRQAAERDYAAVIDADMNLDMAATERLRAQRR